MSIDQVEVERFANSPNIAEHGYKQKETTETLEDLGYVPEPRVMNAKKWCRVMRQRLDTERTKPRNRRNHVDVGQRREVPNAFHDKRPVQRKSGTWKHGGEHKHARPAVQLPSEEP